MHNATTLELNRQRPETSGLVTRNKQSSKLDQEGFGSNPDRKSFLWFGGNFVPGVQFPQNFSGLSSVEGGEFRRWQLFACPPCAIQPSSHGRPAPGWKAKCGHSAQTVTPGSCRLFFAPSSSCFGDFFPTVVPNCHNPFCLW